MVHDQAVFSCHNPSRPPAATCTAHPAPNPVPSCRLDPIRSKLYTPSNLSPTPCRLPSRPARQLPPRSRSIPAPSEPWLVFLNVSDVVQLNVGKASTCKDTLTGELKSTHTGSLQFVDKDDNS